MTRVAHEGSAAGRTRNRLACEIGAQQETREIDVAILMAMTAAEHLTLADVKNRLSEVVDRVEREHGRVIITKHGRPAAVVLSIEDLEGLEETLELLADPKIVRRIKKANAELVDGKSATLTKE